MPNQSRIGDLGCGVCFCHIVPISMMGPIVSGSSTHITASPPTSRVGDIVMGYCGHSGTLISGSSTAIVEGSNSCRIGDPFVGCFVGTIIQGASTAITGG